MGNFKMVIMVIFVLLMLTSCSNKDQSGVLKPVLIESHFSKFSIDMKSLTLYNIFKIKLVNITNKVLLTIYLLFSV